MKALGFLAITVGAVMACPLASANWYQAGYDAARTSTVPFALPTNDDVALVIDLPELHSSGPAWGETPPVIVGRVAYVALPGYINTSLPLYDDSISDLYRIDLDHPVPARIATIPGWTESLATDGNSLFTVSDAGILTAVPIGPGGQSWNRSLVDVPKASPGGQVVAFCAPLAVAKPMVLAACAATQENRVFVTALDAATGIQRWSWRMEDGTTSAEPTPADPTKVPDYALQRGFAGSAAPVAVETIGVTVLGDMAILSTYENHQGQDLSDLWGIALGGGAALWHRSEQSAYVMAYRDVRMNGQAQARVPAAVTGNATSMFGKSHDLFRFALPKPKFAEVQKTLGNELESDLGSGLAYDGQSLYAGSLHAVYRLSMSNLHVERTWHLPTDQFVGSDAPVKSANCLLVRTVRGVPLDGIREPDNAPNVIWCLDPFTLEPIWQFDFYQTVHWAATDGLVVVLDELRVVVIGVTESSLVAKFRATTQYPQPGAPVAIDLSPSLPGAQGPANSYSIDGGDGTQTDWQNNSVLTHDYPLTQEYTARVKVRNQAGQTASAWIPFHVGADDPKASFLQLAFTPKYQERTYFVLGFLATLLLAAIGVVRFRIRHARFQQQLREIDQMFARHRKDPDVCVAMLEERRFGIRDLLLRRKLDESHVGTLERRIDELHRMVRMQLIDDRFEFLPVGLVKRLRAILEDGLVTRLEESQLFDALEQDPSLLPAQKAKLRKVLATWSEADEGRAAARADRRSG